MTESTLYEKADFSEIGSSDEFYDCRFVSCDFSDRTIRKTAFEKCVFDKCNFAMTVFACGLRDAAFTDCKMIGADLSAIDRFSNALSFNRCNLDYASFANIKLRGLAFRNCRMHDTSFESAGIPDSTFAGCDMERASFAGADLERADLSAAFNFAIDPRECRLKKTVFSRYRLEGLVSHLNIVIKDA